MPPRKRPVGPAPTAVENYGDPGLHLPAFLHYQEAECGMARNTLAAYRSDLEQFGAWFRTQRLPPLQQLTLQSLTRYLQHLHQRQLAASSVSRHLVAIKMFFRYLVLEGVIKESVVDLLSSPKMWQHLPHVLSPESVNRLLVAPTGEDPLRDRDRALLALLYATGCRASEVVHLQLRDVHLDEGFCRCVGKGNKERIVSLNAYAISVIRHYIENQRSELAPRHGATELLLSRNGRRLTRIMVWRLVKKYARRIGASEEVSPHTLRHSFATHLLAGGAEIRALQEILGHASIATTQIYTQVEHSRLKAVHRRCHPRG